MAAVIYLLDNIPFKDYNVYVSDSSGIFNKTKFKEGVKKDWSDEHGYDIDLQNRFKDSRSMTISCFVHGKSLYECLNNYNNFLNALDSKGSRRLSVIINSNLRMEAQVFRDDETDTKFLYDDANSVATFEIKLVENFPVKTILKKKENETTITIQSDKVMVINWGDGIEQYTSSKTTTYSHRYLTNDERYIIIYGDLDAITNFQTNAETIWSKF